MSRWNISYDDVASHSPQSYSDSSYENMFDDELMECFQPETWNKICEDEKEMLAVLQELGNRYAQDHGIWNMPVIEKETNSSLYGGYVERKNTITINLGEAKKNPLEVLDTVAHEENHAFQCQCITNNQGGYTEEERALLKAQNAPGVYINKGSGYLSQSLEADSNNAGLQFVLQHKDKFEHLPEFETYINGRSDYYHEVVDCYEESPEKITLSEYGQILKAYSMGKITQEEAEKARNCLQEGYNFIRTEGATLRDQVREIQYELDMQKQYQQDDGLDFLEEGNIQEENTECAQEEAIEVLNLEENQMSNGYTME